MGGAYNIIIREVRMKYIIENKNKMICFIGCIIIKYQIMFYKVYKDNYSQEINYKIDNGILYNKYFRIVAMFH